MWHGRPAHETRARCPCHTARRRPCATKGQVFRRSAAGRFLEVALQATGCWCRDPGLRFACPGLRWSRPFGALPLRGRNKARMARNRLVTGGMRVERVFCTHFCTYKSDEKFGVRRQAVFRATPLFKHEYGGRAVRKSGAATRAQRGSCHRTPEWAQKSQTSRLPSVSQFANLLTFV